jgi:hypothetical protein
MLVQICSYLMFNLVELCETKNCIAIDIKPHLCVLTLSLNSSLVCFRLIAKYRPTMPVLSVVIPRLTSNQLRWSFTGAFQVCYRNKVRSLLFCHLISLESLWIYQLGSSN